MGRFSDDVSMIQTLIGQGHLLLLLYEDWLIWLCLLRSFHMRFSITDDAVIWIDAMKDRALFLVEEDW